MLASSRVVVAAVVVGFCSGCVQLAMVSGFHCDDGGLCDGASQTSSDDGGGDQPRDAGARVDAGVDGGVVANDRMDAGDVDAGPADGGEVSADAGEFDAGEIDAGALDAGLVDAGAVDAGSFDAGVTDAGARDAGPSDAGSVDAGTTDAGPRDAGSPDAGPVDAGPADAGIPDAGVADAGLPDAGPRDAGAPDSGAADAGTPDAGVVITIVAPPSVEAGACVPFTATRSGDLSASLTVNAMVSNAGLQLSTSSTCSTATGSATWPAQQSSLTLYVRGNSADNVDVTLTLGTNTAHVIALPLVRRGRCTLIDGVTSIRCPILPAIPHGDISRTFVLTTPLSTEMSPENAFAACALETNSGIAELFCKRMTASGSVTMAWQTASHGRPSTAGGWSVRQFVINDLDQSTDLSLGMTGVDVTRSFVLLSHATSGTYWGANDFVSTTLFSNVIRLTVGSPGFSTPNRVALQLVESAQVSVAHTEQMLDGGQAAAWFTDSTVTSQHAIPLFTQTFTTSSGTQQLPCATGYTAERWPTSTVVSKSDAGCRDYGLATVSLQLIQFQPGAWLSQSEIGLAAGIAGARAPIQLQAHRTLVFLPQQGSGGVGVGTTRSMQSAPPGSTFAAVETLSDGGYWMTRGASTTDVDVHLFPIQLTP